MSATRFLLMSLVGLALGAAPASAQPPWAGGGGGGGGRGRMDPNQFFNQLSNGKDVITRSEITDPNMQGMFDRFAERMGVTNGQITREQFVTYMSQRRGQGGGRGGAGPAAPGGGNGQAGGEPQWVAWAQRMFQQLDQNGDGLLNNDEMPEELRSEREKWDTNGDGFIDFNEFKAYFQARVQQRMAESGVADAASPGDGLVVVVTPANPEEEKRPVVYRAGKLPKSLPAWFAQLDADQDGQISLYEWRASGRPLEEFERIDRNGDGFLTPEEVLRDAANSKNAPTRAFAAGPGGPSGPGSGTNASAGGGRRARGDRGTGDGANGGRRRGRPSGSDGP